MRMIFLPFEESAYATFAKFSSGETDHTQRKFIVCLAHYDHAKWLALDDV